MANECDFIIKIVGTKEACLQSQKYFEDMQEGAMVAVITSNFVKPGCEIESIPDSSSWVYTFMGSCKWSVESSMRNHISKKFITLQELAKKLHVKMEYFSQECGFEFAEHAVIDGNGFVTHDECVGFYEVDAKQFETFDDFLEEYNDNIDTCVANNDIEFLKEQFDSAKENEDNCWFSFGGLEENFTIL